MASNLISRLLPVTDTSRSIYETLRQDEDDSDGPDIEQRAGQALDEQNLGHHFQDIDPDDLQLNASRVTSQSKSNTAEARRKRSGGIRRTKNVEVEDADDEVPASLLIEGNNLQPVPRGLGLSPRTTLPSRPIPVAGAASKATKEHWEATQKRQSLYPHPSAQMTGPGGSGTELLRFSFADRRQKAMWRWANVENLDIFLTEVYIYYLGNGFFSTMLQRTLQLLTFAFVAGFTIFLASCVNYDNLRPSGRLSQVLVYKCTSHMSGGSSFAIWVVSFLWVMKLFQYLLDIRRLRNLHDFYQHLLGISDSEIQSISWQEIVSRLMALRDANPTTATVLPAQHRRYLGSQSKQRMDAHDIANRLMRKENYLIALFNKEVLDLTLPLPFIGKRQLFSRTLEWNINQCVMDYVFNEHGQVRPLFLKDTHRKALSEGLRRRFKFAGTLNIFVAPFLVTYFLVHYFFSYFTEYQRNPSQIGSRHYNPLAEWKFREFNELWHLFQRRINMSYPFASRYVDQFPKDKTVQLSRFVAFLAGALASVLAVASVIDPEMFLNFEITQDRSVIFYLGVFGSIWAVARGMLPEENLVYEPEFALQEVIDFTHYKPAHWEGRLHSDAVRKEFGNFYQLKLLIFLEEILSMIFTPFVLWFSLPNCSDRIVDFFREFTVHVDGLGYVCSFAEFNFKKQSYVARPQPKSSSPEGRAGAAYRGGQARQDLRADYYATKDQKLEASYWGFMNDYARNPKTDIRFPYTASRRGFFPPPPFPGPLSPSLPADRPDLTFAGSRPDDVKKLMNERASSGHHDFGHGSPNDRSSKIGDMKATGLKSGDQSSSLVASMLLDPHHHPATLGFSQPHALGLDNRMSPGHRPHPKSRRSVKVGEIDHELREYPEPDAESSKEGILGSSWGLEQQSDGSGEEEDVDTIIGHTRAGGVLGMIKQFQKVQGEARGAP